VALVVDMPLNTMLADLDESLRALVQRELKPLGFDSVEVAFDAPAREWSSQLAAPTVNMFLYDLRESADHRHRTIDERRVSAGAFETRPPLILECSYAMTAWTQEVEDEHRLLSQLLTVLYSYPRLPADALVGRLSNGAQRYPIFGRVGQPKSEGKADFWNAVGGQYKASLDYIVTLSCEAGVAHERGPEARGVTVRVGDSSGPPGEVTELHRAGGVVTAAGGEPVAEAWITLPDLGRWTSSDDHGHFAISRVPSGEHRCVARTRDGDEAEATLAVPGGTMELVVGPARGRRRATGRGGGGDAR
jgi:hypothetical protein